jgi:hypothetical protein
VATPGPLPTFLIIGAQKSATRWLRLNLGEHPDVFTAAAELSFFNAPERFAKGTESYSKQFDGWNGERIVGEATPGYMMYRRKRRERSAVAKRIFSVDPEMRLLAVLRNPVDRTYSAYVHHLRRGRIPTDVDVLSYVRSVRPREDPLHVVSGGWYHASLKPFRRIFGDKLLVLLHDDVNRDPVSVYRTALAHVGADTSFLPPELAEVRFGNVPPRESGLRDGEGSYKPLTLAQRRELYGYFRDDIRRLQQMLGVDLSAWTPPTRSDPRPNLTTAAG